uniref:Uncharacterized protein n=1 Tax=Amphiprion percula TaxID=161767 RepID=A0A3P8T9H5_AMPPE
MGKLRLMKIHTLMKLLVEDLVAVFPQRLHLHTGDAVEQTLELPIPRHTWDAVVAVEQLPPQELISGDSEPLSAGLTGSQHGIVGQTQEDLQHQAVRKLESAALLNTRYSHLSFLFIFCFLFSFL